jgi:hypothetical protein
MFNHPTASSSREDQTLFSRTSKFSRFLLKVIGCNLIEVAWKLQGHLNQAINSKDTIADDLESLKESYMSPSAVPGTHDDVPVRITDLNARSKPNVGMRVIIFSMVITLAWLGAGNGLAADWKSLHADGRTNTMPVHWDQASPKIIPHLDPAKLERGEVLCEIKKIDAQTAVGQTAGLIKADPSECFKTVRKYNQYVQLMPHTVESRVIRSFRLEGDNAGAEAVDFWTRVHVLGFDIRYLLRIAHLTEPQSRRFRSFWTLVDEPAQIAGCCGSEKTPCENDLALNLGSHQFEPYPGNPNYTLHIYTVTFAGKNWLQQMAFRMGGRKDMQEVTQAIRKALLLKD